MSRTVELVTTIGAAALGALLVVMLIGASLVLAVPGVVAVAVVATVATRRHRS